MEMNTAKKTPAKGAAPKTAKPAKAAPAKAAPKAKVDPDVITSVSGAKGDADVAVTAGAGTVLFKNQHYTPALVAAAKVGQSFAAVKALVAAAKLSAPKGAKLAGGLNGRTAPHSSKAVGDAAAKAKASAPKVARVAKPEVAKTENGNRSTKGVVSTRNGDQKITVLAKTNPYKEGSKAHATFELFAKAKTVAGFKELVAAKPGSFDPGYIRYSARDGFIKVG